MSTRQKIWARAARQNIIKALGGECEKCGTIHNLTLDCIKPRGAAHHKLDTSQRMAFYRAQHEKQNLQLLCRKCNSAKSDSKG